MRHFLLAYLSHVPLQALISHTLVKLMLAAVLGGAIGLERELKHRPAGLRTNMFICFGAALFTVLSAELAGEFTGDHTRIAAQIIPGIGFIGAGSILHAKNGVSGLTTAATIFVVASIGMASGAGLYSLATFSTLLILLALLILGWVEGQFNLKPLTRNYTILTDKSADDLMVEINACLEECALHMQALHLSKINGASQIIFGVSGTRRMHEQLTDCLRRCHNLRSLASTRSYESE
jgi:putative Mg2+ transporter-C (MgtC) family protein